MEKRDARIDAYINDSAQFSLPLLKHVRGRNFSSNPIKTGAKKSSVASKFVPTFAAALHRIRKVLDSFDKSNSSQQKAHIEWIAEAKSEATRDRCLKQGLECIAERKSRHWKYAK